jgi:hypothetical protein
MLSFMTTATFDLQQFAESATLPDQEIFTTGTHRGKHYSHRDLDEIVANFRRHSIGEKARLRVPAVIGHEENQEYLDRSDLPAAGWMQELRNLKQICPKCRGSGKLRGDDGEAACPQCVGTGVASTLRATFGNVPRKVSKLLKRKAYRTVSAEIYDKPPEGVPGRGKMLRRVAFLGGEIPQIKSIDEINELYEHGEDLQSTPLTRLSFSHANCNDDGRYWTCFSEVKPMDREQMIQRLQSMGFSADVLESADDKLLAEILRVYDSSKRGDDSDKKDDYSDEAAGPSADDANALGGESPFAEQEDDEGDDDSEEDDEPKSTGDLESYAAKARRAYDRACKMMEKCRRARMKKAGRSSSKDDEQGSADFGEPEKANHDAPAADGRPSGSMSAADAAQLLREVIRQEINSAVKDGAQESIGELKKYREEIRAYDKQEAVDAILERYRDRIPPRMRSHYQTLLSRADTRFVGDKFGDNGRSRDSTEFDRVVAEISQLPGKFAEHFGESARRDGGANLDAKDWAEATYDKHAAAFKRMGGMKKSEFVEMARKAEDDGTLEKFRAVWDASPASGVA